MAISIEDIKRLRELSGVGMTDAKQALDAANGDFDAALKEMRRRFRMGGCDWPGYCVLVKTAVAVGLVVKPVAKALALIVVDAFKLIFLGAFGEEAVGSEPFVV